MPNGLHKYLQKLIVKATQCITDVFSQPSVLHRMSKAYLERKSHLYYGALWTEIPMC
jgi:hypothetical protein